MINLLEESVRTAVKESIQAQIMDWSDSVFREHPKYYGDVGFKKDIPTIGDNGIVTSKKYLAFRTTATQIGILSTDFSTGIDEKLAQGRKAEYGSKVYTTTDVPTLDTPNNGTVNVLQFSPFNDNLLFCGDSNGALTVFDMSDSKENKQSETFNIGSVINSVCSHECSSEVLAIGAKNSISLIDLNRNGQCLVETKMDNKIGDGNITNLCFSGDGNYLQCITDSQYLFIYDPRSDSTVENAIKLRFTPHNICNFYGNKTNQIAVCGMTSYLEPILYGYDVRKAVPLSEDSVYENYVFKHSFNYKQCRPMMSFDCVCGLLYVSFQGCADVIALNVNANGCAKQSLYHSVSDTFQSFAVLPKHSCKKREINKVVKFSKTRIQQIVHTRGGKLIYESVSSKPKQSSVSANAYFAEQTNASYDYRARMGKCVSADFAEQKQRKVSLYLHITGKEAQSNSDKYFDLKISQTINCSLGVNVKCNHRFAAFPCPTYGGGALGVIGLDKFGRKKQSQLSAHSEKITTFDIGRNEGNSDLVITGAGDCKAIISRICTKESNLTISNIEKLHTLQCNGKVTFVAFHPRLKSVCVIAANNQTKSDDEANVYLYDYESGAVLQTFALEKTKNIFDIQFEPNIGLLCAVSSQNGSVKLMNVRNGSVVFEFESATFARDTKVFWANAHIKAKRKYFTQIVCLGFGKGSVRKFCLYDLESVVSAFYAQNCKEIIIESADIDAKEERQTYEAKEEMKSENNNSNALAPMFSHTFGVSNAVPIGFFDGYNNLFYVSSIGDRKIRAFEFSKKGISEMNASYQSKADIYGFDFGLKQFINVEKVEQIKCLKLTKDGVISPISFYIPRKRIDYFQNDLYCEVLDVFSESAMFNMSDDTIRLKYVSLKPANMELLSEAPKERETEHQKRRNSQIKLMEASKLKEQPQSTEQAFDQFSRMVADAPTQNRWDAQNIGTEVAEDEWSD